MTGTTTAAAPAPRDAYHWLRPDSEGAPRVLPPAALASADLRRGAWLDRAPTGPLVFTIEDDARAAAPPHWLGDRVPLVSERLLAALRRAGVDNLQTFPALLQGRAGGQPRPGHTVLNVIGAVDAADADASVGTVLIEDDPGPRLVQYTQLVLSRARARDLDMFRLADSPEMLLVHDRVLRVLAADVPDEGWGFTPIEIELV
jgi:hypothetical protein